MSDLLNRTEQKAQEAKEQAQDAYDEALGIYSDANSINLPDVDIDSLRDNADTIKDDVSHSQGAAMCSQIIQLLNHFLHTKQEALTLKALN